MPDWAARRLLPWLTALAVLSYFLFFTWRSAALYFDQDDMMNLYFAWSKPLGQVLKANVFFWSDSFRPLGALFYRGMYAAAGFHPLPFRIVCLFFGITNIGLCYWFVRLLGVDRRVGALTILLFAFQSRLMEVWFRTAVVYDLLSFTFFYIAASLYIQARRAGGQPSLWRTATIVGCYICALNSKEGAVALPVALVAYEGLLQRPAIRHFLLPVFMGLLNIPYILGKTMGAGAMTNNPDYRSEFTFTRFAHTWSLYLNYLFVRADSITPRIAILILAATLCVALFMRSRVLIFAWALLFTATLPVSFLEYRGGFVLYLSYVGWCLYGAWLLVKLEDLVPRHRMAIACAAFVLVGWRAGKTNLRDQRADPRTWLYDPPRMVRAMADQVRTLEPSMPRGARTLFLNDEFSGNDWTPLFILRLLYADETLVVDRVKRTGGTPDQAGYRYVFTYDSGRYRQLKP